MMLPKQTRVFCRTTFNVADITSKCGVAVISKIVRNLIFGRDEEEEEDDEEEEEDDDDEDDEGSGLWGAIIRGW